MCSSCLNNILYNWLYPLPRDYYRPLHYTHGVTLANSPKRDSKPSPVPTTKSGKEAGRTNGIRTGANERILGKDGGVGMKKEKLVHVSYHESSAWVAMRKYGFILEE